MVEDVDYSIDPVSDYDTFSRGPCLEKNEQQNSCPFNLLLAGLSRREKRVRRDIYTIGLGEQRKIL